MAIELDLVQRRLRRPEHRAKIAGWLNRIAGAVGRGEDVSEVGSGIHR